MIPIATPFERVSMHVVQAPSIRRVAADFRGATERWSGFRAIVRLAFEIRLFAAQLVPESCGGRRPGAAGVFPLRFGGQPTFPMLRQSARVARQVRNLSTDCP